MLPHGRRRNSRREHRQNLLSQGLQPGGFQAQQHTTFDRRQGPIGMLIGLIVDKVHEKKHPENKAFVEGGREQASGFVRGEEVREQASGYVRAPEGVSEMEGDSEHARGFVRTEEVVAGREADREGEYQANGREQPPGYEEVVRGRVEKE